MVVEKVDEAKQLTLAKYKPLLELINGLDTTVNEIDNRLIELYKTVKGHKYELDSQIKYSMKTFLENLNESK